jgi:hypothetical protein
LDNGNQPITTPLPVFHSLVLGLGCDLLAALSGRSLLLHRGSRFSFVDWRSFG